MKVLIVDDEKLARVRLRELIMKIGGHAVVGEAINGSDAIEQAVKLQPDVMLMDIRMPVMDGLEATQRIKETWPDVKVIILTMYPYYERQALAAGADCFLVKGDKTQSIQDAILSLFSPENSTNKTLDCHLENL